MAARRRHNDLGRIQKPAAPGGPIYSPNPDNDPEPTGPLSGPDAPRLSPYQPEPPSPGQRGKKLPTRGYFLDRFVY